MSSSVTVLCPNARRVIVKTTPNTSILQILEEACVKHKYDPNLYSLKHLKRPLDVSATLRFAGLPNRCVLEMMELATPRRQQSVTVCVIDQEGGKHMRDHLPTDSLWTVLESSGVLAAAGEDGDMQPTVVYSMRRIAGQPALTSTTLKALGLNSGRGSLRFLSQRRDEHPAGAAVPAVPAAVVQQQLVAPLQDPAPLPIPNASDRCGSLPEVIPVQMPEIIPVNCQPEVIPLVNKQPEIIPVVIQPEVLANIENSVNNNFANSDQRRDNISNNNDVTMSNNPASRRGNVGGANDAVGGANNMVGVASDTVGGGSVLSPDVVSSSCAVPDVVMRQEDTSLPPDVLNNDCIGSSKDVTTVIEAFSGAGRSLAAASAAGPSASQQQPEQQLPLPQQQQPEEHPMEVDDSAVPGDATTALLRRHDAVLYRASDVPRVAAATALGGDEDDSFFELTPEDLRRQHREQIKAMEELSEAPLLTQGLREAEEQAKLLAAINRFPVTQLRIHLPGELVVQASFHPTDTVQQVAVFVSGLLQHGAAEFNLLNHYPRRPLPLDSTLYAAGLVPKAHLHCCLTATESADVAGDVLQPTVLASISSYSKAQGAVVTARGNRSSVGLRVGPSSSSGDGGGAGRAVAGPSSASSSRTAPSISYTGTTNKPKWFKLAK